MKGFTLNDRLNVGSLAFDIQTEIRNGKIIGEILSGGKVVKKVEVAASNNPIEAVRNTHQRLKESLLERLNRFKNKKDGKRVLNLKPVKKIKETICSAFGMEERQLLGIFFKVGEAAVTEGTNLKEIAENFEKVKGKSKSKIIKEAEILILTVADGVVGVFSKEGVTGALLVEGLKQGYLRKKLPEIEEAVIKALKLEQRG
jgi:hypothetical protein